jgi:hypothetical protein
MKSKRIALIILLLLSLCGNVALIVLLSADGSAVVRIGTYCTDVDAAGTAAPNQTDLSLLDDGTYYLFVNGYDVISSGSYKNVDYGVVLRDTDSDAARYVVPMDHKKFYLINPDGSDLILTHHDDAAWIPDTDRSPVPAAP